MQIVHTNNYVETGNKEVKNIMQLKTPGTFRKVEAHNACVARGQRSSGYPGCA